MMKLRWSFVALAAAGVLAAACGDSTSPSSDNLSDSSMEADLAASSGAELVNSISLMIASEQIGGGDLNRAKTDATYSPPTVSRTFTCYDAHGAVVDCGTGLTASALVTLQVDGTFSGRSLTVQIHRQARDSISGLEIGSTAHTHNGFGAEDDTTTYTEANSARTAGIAAVDSAVSLVFGLPHSSNPWPASGQFIRNVDATFTVTRGGTQTRHITRRIMVSFPADAQGNVPIEVGTLTCNLNLVTGLVSDCTGG